MTHYSTRLREFVCKKCIKEVMDTSKGPYFNALPVESAIEQLKKGVDLQKILDHEDSLAYLEESLKKAKDFQEQVK